MSKLLLRTSRVLYFYECNIATVTRMVDSQRMKSENADLGTMQDPNSPLGLLAGC